MAVGMAINRLVHSNAIVECRGRKTQDNEASLTPFQLTPYLKKEFIKTTLLELALFQMHIFLVIIWQTPNKIEQNQEATNLFSFLATVLTLGVFLLMTLVVSILSIALIVSGFVIIFILVLLSLFPSDPNHQSLLVAAVTVPILFILDWRLPSASGWDASEDGKRRLKRWKIFVRWLGHLILVVLTVIYAFEMETKQRQAKAEYGLYCYVFLTIGMVGKIAIDVMNLNQDDELLKSVPDYVQWIPIKWIVMLLCVYLPLINYGIFNLLLYHDIYRDFSLTLSLAEAVILTISTAHYEEMRLLHGARNIALNAAPVALAGVLFHCNQYGSDLIEIGIGGIKGIAMWTAHFGMAKLYV